MASADEIQGKIHIGTIKLWLDRFLAGAASAFLVLSATVAMVELSSRQAMHTSLSRALVEINDEIASYTTEAFRLKELHSAMPEDARNTEEERFYAMRRDIEHARQKRDGIRKFREYMQSIDMAGSQVVISMDSDSIVDCVRVEQKRVATFDNVTQVLVVSEADASDIYADCQKRGRQRHWYLTEDLHRDYISGQSSSFGLMTAAYSAALSAPSSSRTGILSEFWPPLADYVRALRSNASEVLLVISILCCSILGSLIAGLREEKFTSIGDLILGFAGGFILYLAMKGGKFLFTLNAADGAVGLNPYGLSFMGLLVGLYLRRAYAFLSWLLDRFEKSLKEPVKP